MSSNKANKTADVIIVGGGLAGLSLTALLATYDVNVICIDRDAPQTQQKTAYDGRTTAVSFGSRKILKAAGVWNDIAPQTCPINTIHISDGDSPVLLEFSNEEVEGEAFGWIAENSFLRQKIYQRVMALPTATHIAPATVKDFKVHENHAEVILEDDQILSAPLVIGADGRNSFTRDFMGIDTRGWQYKQSAIVCCVTHEHPHDHVALENFRPEGPLAVLPMRDDENGNHRSSLVWTEHSDAAQSFLNVSEDIFNTALNARFPSHYGQVALSGKRFSYPLGMIHAHEYTAPRMALIAEAAHGMHPIAGQGLNMGFRDVAAIADLIITARKNNEDTGSPALLAEYQRQRRFDNTAMVAATDTLNKLFSNKTPGIRGVRKAGLHAVARLPFAKQFFMKQAMGASSLLADFIDDENLNEKDAA
jgi:2-octaprenyl-6-methoxyphenol hydroxylase